MALIARGETCCALCNAVIGKGDEIVATTHFIADPSDPLWEYSDAAMHRACFLKWERRLDFVAKYNATMGVNTWGLGTYHEMLPDGSVVKRHRGHA